MGISHRNGGRTRHFDWGRHETTPGWSATRNSWSDHADRSCAVADGPWLCALEHSFEARCTGLGSTGLCVLNGKLSGSRSHYVKGCFRIAAKECSRAESAGLLAVAALFSNDGSMRCNFASMLGLMCELSAF